MINCLSLSNSLTGKSSANSSNNVSKLLFSALLSLTLSTTWARFANYIIGSLMIWIGLSKIQKVQTLHFFESIEWRSQKCREHKQLMSSLNTVIKKLAKVNSGDLNRQIQHQHTHKTRDDLYCSYNVCLWWLFFFYYVYVCIFQGCICNYVFVILYITVICCT